MPKNGKGVAHQASKENQHLQSALKDFSTDLSYLVKKDSINNPELEGLLKQAAQDVTLDSYSRVLKHLFSEIRAARDTNLYPSKNHQPKPGEGNTAHWDSLVSDAGNVALRLIQEVSKDTNDRSKANRTQRQSRAKQVILALQFMLLAQLYAIRAAINENDTATEVVDNYYKQTKVVIKDLLKACRDYNAQARDWNLHQELPRGWKEASDATAYKAWSQDFGTESTAEIDWSPFARAVGSELRYQSHRMEVRQLWSEVWCVGFTPTDLDRLEAEQVQRRWSEDWYAHSTIIQWLMRFLKAPKPNLGAHPKWLGSIQWPVRFLKALLLWLFKVTVGFGLKPARFVCTVIGTIITFFLFYFIDDTVARCKDMAGSTPSYWQEIYYAIGNFTSVGTGSGGPCGPYTGLLISIETLMGYFLLSVLAAMLIARIIDR